MDITSSLGILAAILTTSAFVPQVIKTWKTRSTGDLSLFMFLMLFTGTLCWLIYGLLRKDLPIIAANGVTLGLSFIILFFKLKESPSGQEK
ncbi:MAG: hypothetical protein RI973_1760 [Bacteroidota bacterium]|jgi:MtN3 and saliva related transmembrane protein